MTSHHLFIRADIPTKDMWNGANTFHTLLKYVQSQQQEILCQLF